MARLLGSQSSLPAHNSELSQNGCFSISWDERGAAFSPAHSEVRLRPAILAGAVLLAAVAGWTDLRTRRIPNWLTVPAFALGIVANTILNGRAGLKDSLLGALLGFGLLLPFYLLRSMGAGDLKFVVALGAFTGPGRLVDVLIGSVFVAGAMALILVIYKRRLLETLRNIGHILVSLVTFRLPGSHVTLDDPNSLKIPKGVALSLTVVFYAVLELRGVLA